MSHSIFLGLNFGAFYFFGFEFWGILFFGGFEFRVILLFWVVEICSRMSIPVKEMLVCPPLGHSYTFAKALAKINVPEYFVRNPDRIDSIRLYRRLHNSQAPGPSFVEAPAEVPRKTPKNPTTSALLFGKWLKHLVNKTLNIFSNPTSIKYNVDYT